MTYRMYRIRVKYLRILRGRKAGTGTILFVPVNQSSACVASPWLNFGGAILDVLVRLRSLIYWELTSPTVDSRGTPKLSARPNSLAFLLPSLLDFALVYFSFLLAPTVLEK